ncbi:LytTR family DNA-binding domain-containing protein [Vagococcus penaei]|uniref:HTH LytTR-type domain-containing protein n=1 Tax=Vagococcus penaei TaxID=633807 RepID=A0A1Q2D5A1_9ENTE|nr:LytTR family DNA-binding domain-containing protein [Vagococcus penaei]AQP53580.1 hypothetical protein BW732_04605 [Vagococcus penaei]
MKVNYQWNQDMSKNEIDIISHPANELLLSRLKQSVTQHLLSVIDPRNNRTVMLNVTDIEVIETLGHLSFIITRTGESYHYQKRLKDLTYLEAYNLVRINQSTILNLDELVSFTVEQHARLEVCTKNGNQYIVSRHYAKKIKERLS